ncbi:MAG: DUF4389 domain-containing protein [Nanoarchaeota archaeon]|nr:DUF4389 domain-containing protein [Nanoarchaeota archaeon]
MIKKGERKEAWFRIIVLIISGIALYLWGYVILFLTIINWLVAVFSGKYNLGISEFCGIWVKEYSRFLSYMTFQTNERAFPFNPLIKK